MTDIPVQPAGVEHTYAAHELFFSTTDLQGRIRRANSTFMRLAGYPRGALVGKPHNVVRHELMPAGVFRSIWEAIGNGEAASAYITNKSSDGGYYRVFATIMPSRNGYLSVRTLPLLTCLRDKIEIAYGRVLEVERASATAGSSAREVAAAGQAALQTELAALGYKDEATFTRQTLPAEVEALVAAGVNIPQVPAASGPVATVLTQMQEIEQATEGLVELLEECARLVSLLGVRSAQIGDLHKRLAQLRQNLYEITQTVDRFGVGAEADAVRERYAQVDALVLECFEQLRPLSGQVEQLRDDTDSVRFAIALVRLLNLAAGFFASQILDGQDALAANDAVGSLREVIDTLHTATAKLREQVDLYRARAELVGGELDVVANSLTVTHRPLLDLLAAAADAGAANEISVRQARSLVRDGFPEARDLADLAGQVRDLEVPEVSAAIDSCLREVEVALEELG